LAQMPLPLERILRCVPEPPLCVRANQRDGIAIPASRRSPLGRQARPKAHLLGSRPNRENTQANQAAGTIFWFIRNRFLGS
jgi:hypothetical protein